MEYHKVVDGKYWLMVSKNSEGINFLNPTWISVIREANIKKMIKRKEFSKDIFNKKNRQDELDALWKKIILERTGAIDLELDRDKAEFYLIFESEEDCAKWLFLNG